jgi:DNA-binding MarR family transcriptional regulator
MRRIGEMLQAEVQQLMELRSVPIQANQYPLLTSLDKNGPLTIGELADALGVSQRVR